MVADIAGGLGNLLLEILKRNPTLKGILFDQPHVLNKNILHQLNDDSRWVTQAGSFFEKCPEADIYLLKHITHNWGNDKIVTIFNTIRRAMKPTSKLLILSYIISEDNEPYFGKLIGLACMSLLDGGGEHTESELKALIDQANLKINRIIPTKNHMYIIETAPV